MSRSRSQVGEPPASSTAPARPSTGDANLPFAIVRDDAAPECVPFPAQAGIAGDWRPIDPCRDHDELSAGIHEDRLAINPHHRKPPFLAREQPKEIAIAPVG